MYKLYKIYFVAMIYRDSSGNLKRTLTRKLQKQGRKSRWKVRKTIDPVEIISNLLQRNGNKFKYLNICCIRDLV